MARYEKVEQTGLEGTGATAGLGLQNDEKASISISGISTATVLLERQLPGQSTWQTVKSYSADAEETYEADERGEIRLRVSAWTSGTINIRLGKG